jgi:pyrroline-5-carboxylate reductase
MTVVSLPEDIEIPDSVYAVIDWIFKNTGRCIFLAEKYQDVATALCGSGPAFMYLVLEALCDGAVRMGMPYDVAKECASQVLIGAGKMVQEGGHPASLRTAVCTPGGTTIGGLLKMEDAGVRAGVARAVEEATNIATALGKK